VSTDPYRLDRRAVPRHYDLIIEPDAAAGTFTGTVTIGSLSRFVRNIKLSDVLF
jgi:hypothetical protein